ncbi:MAG: hypothetical protein Q9227_003805 [Pyrenula ochraceoflavens]
MISGALRSAATTNEPLPRNPSSAMSGDSRPPPAPQEAATEIIQTRNMTAQPLEHTFRVGNTESSFGVKVQRHNSQETFMTVSSHAAFDSVNKRPATICGQKASRRWGLLQPRFKPWNSVKNTNLVTSNGQNMIGTIVQTLDRLPQDRQPIFPDDFRENISFVRLRNQQSSILRSDALTWCQRSDMTFVPVKIVSDPATAKSFILGAYYPKSHTFSGREGSLTLKDDTDTETFRRFLLFRRLYYNPLTANEARALRGAPVLTTDVKKLYTEVVGFMAFHFSPPSNTPEEDHDKREVVRRVMQGRATVCGASLASDEFKAEWNIVG